MLQEYVNILTLRIIEKQCIRLVQDALNSHLRQMCSRGDEDTKRLAFSSFLEPSNVAIKHSKNSNWESSVQMTQCDLLRFFFA